MAKLTPLQEVNKRFGSKEKLAKKLAPLLERPEDVEKGEFEQQISTASNKQLLRLHRVHETIKKRYGSKEKLVDAIVAKKFPKGNADYKAKLLTHRPTRLLDLVR
jgi:hypothetical protein